MIARAYLVIGVELNKDQLVLSRPARGCSHSLPFGNRCSECGAPAWTGRYVMVSGCKPAGGPVEALERLRDWRVVRTDGGKRLFAAAVVKEVYAERPVDFLALSADVGNVRQVMAQGLGELYDESRFGAWLIFSSELRDVLG